MADWRYVRVAHSLFIAQTTATAQQQQEQQTILNHDTDTPSLCNTIHKQNKDTHNNTIQHDDFVHKS